MGPVGPVPPIINAFIRCFIGQIMTGKASARTMEDVSLTYLTAQEALAATSENPLVVKKITLEADLRKYERLLGAHQLETYQGAARRAKWEGEVKFHTDRARAILPAPGGSPCAALNPWRAW